MLAAAAALFFLACAILTPDIGVLDFDYVEPAAGMAMIGAFAIDHRPRRPGREGGTVYPRSDRNLWVAEITVDGNRIRKHFPTRSQALAALAELQAAAGAMRADAGTLGGYLERWAQRPANVAPKTAMFYQGIVRTQWLPNPLTRKELVRVTRDDVQEALDQLAATQINRTTLLHCRAVLSTALAAAVRARLINANPVLGTKLARRPTPNRVRTIRMSADTAAEIRAAVAGSEWDDLFNFLLDTGVRLGEALGLDWSDVVFEHREGEHPTGLIHVRHALKQEPGGWFIGPPKTDGSRRDIAIGERATVRLLLRNQAAGGPATGLVFPCRSDPAATADPISISKSFRAHMDAAGVGGQITTPGGRRRSELQLRDLRSLHASILISRGASIAAVSRRLGHATPTTTWARYAGVINEDDRRAAQLLVD